jgi:hypothetical protein
MLRSCAQRCLSSRTHGGGRVVLNQSTHVDGLIDRLRAIVSSPGVENVIDTAVPGRLSTCKGFSDALTLSVTVPVLGGFRAIARKGRGVQEVFFKTSLAKDALQTILDGAAARK